MSNKCWGLEEKHVDRFRNLLHPFKISLNEKNCLENSVKNAACVNDDFKQIINKPLEAVQR